MTETVVCVVSYRENGTRWKPFMRKPDENHSRAVMLKYKYILYIKIYYFICVSVTVCLR